MNFSKYKTSIFLGFQPSEGEADFHHIMPLVRNSWVILGMGLFTLIGIGAAVNVASKFGILEGFSSEEGLSSLATFTFNLGWLIGWCFGILLSIYIFILTLIGRGSVFINEGILEMNLGLSFLRFGKRIPLSNIASVELVEAEKQSIFVKGGQALLVTTKDKNNLEAIGCNFTAQDLAQLKSAITLNENAEQSSANLTEPELPNEDEFINHDKRSLWALILANCVPLFGAYFLDWEVGEMMILYWAETLILLLYQSIRNVAVSPIIGFFKSLFNSCQVIMFSAVHFLFIWFIFVEGFWTPTPEKDDSLQTVFNYLFALWPALVALFVSHGYSLFIHFFKNPKAEQTQLGINPLFVRITIMQLVVIFGGILALLTNGHWTTLLLLVVLKTIFDGKAHCKQHNLQL